MDKITLKCKKCGNIRDIDISTDEIVYNKCCVECGGDMISITELNQEQLEKIVNLFSIDKMKQNIQRYGNNRIWGAIEKIGNAKQRTAFRKLFFQSGGAVPDTTVI